MEEVITEYEFKGQNSDLGTKVGKESFKAEILVARE